MDYQTRRKSILLELEIKCESGCVCLYNVDLFVTIERRKRVEKTIVASTNLFI